MLSEQCSGCLGRIRHCWNELWKEAAAAWGRKRLHEESCILPHLFIVRLRFARAYCGGWIHQVNRRRGARVLAEARNRLALFKRLPPQRL